MVSVGDVAPDFRLKASDGKEYSLSSFRGKNVVLYFYPKDDTPGCTKEACGFRDAIEKIRKKNAIVLGISRDSVDSHRKFSEKYGLNFPLLSDPDGTVCTKYGVLKEKNLYGKKSMGIVRTTFIIDEKGSVAKIFSPVKPDGHEREVIESL